MGLHGQGALIFWHDIGDGADADYEAWHSHEHMKERLGVPGFLRGRRGLRAEPEGPQYLILYEVEDVSVLTSAPYLARLNDPSPWTRRVVANFTNTNRTIARITVSAGSGLGTFMLTARFSPVSGREGALRDWLSQIAFPEFVSRPGLTGAHLLESDVSASNTDTGEKKLRDGPDAVADWVILLEGYDDEAVAEAGSFLLTSDGLAGPGAIGDWLTDPFCIVHSVS
jgi:hypothetical protein